MDRGPHAWRSGLVKTIDVICVEVEAAVGVVGIWWHHVCMGESCCAGVDFDRSAVDLRWVRARLGLGLS